MSAELWAEYDRLSGNPVARARFAELVNLHLTTRPTATTSEPDPRDGAARFASLRPQPSPIEPATPTEQPIDVTGEDERMTTWRALNATNQIIASRYALEHGLWK